jgi:hypothetical protein
MSDEFVKEKDQTYDKLVKYYNLNKDKGWNNWLEFDSIFNNIGKQGIAGLLKVKNKKKRYYVFKLSQHVNYLSKHENEIMNGLNELSSFCAHFCRGIGTIQCEIEPRHKKRINPFEITSKYPIKKEVLLCEYIDGRKFSDLIDDKNVDEDLIYSSIKQVLMALIIAQKNKKFCSYDLHSDNIMMRDCDKDIVFLYVIDDDNQFYVPTHGKYPVIIDFGFSYINNLEDTPLWTSLAHTQVGFMSDRFDWVADPKLFLVTVSSEMKTGRKSKKSRILRKIVRNVFHPLTIDWESGWDVNKIEGAADSVTQMMYDYNSKSKLFEDYSHYCIDLFQSLVIQPLQPQSTDDFKKSFKAFIKEWIKIENEITNPFYNLYILQGVIDSARFVRPDYMSKDFKKDAVKKFKEDTYTRISEVANFCVPKQVNFEILLCSLLVIARNIEGLLYQLVSQRMLDKTREYNKLPLQSVEQIYAAIEVNLPDEYIFNEKTSIVVFDVKNKQTKSFKLPHKYMLKINEISPLSRGTYIYNKYKKRENIK